MQADELAFTPITRQAEMVRSGEIAPRELVEAYLERIDASTRCSTPSGS